MCYFYKFFYDDGCRAAAPWIGRECEQRRRELLRMHPRIPRDWRPVCRDGAIDEIVPYGPCPYHPPPGFNTDSKGKREKKGSSSSKKRHVRFVDDQKAFI
jgi:hypothetical protein